MDDLHQPLLIEILTRLDDSADVARCRLVSRALNAISREVRSVNLVCSFDRYMKSRDPLTQSSITPFKEIFKSIISSRRIVERVSIGIEKPLRTVSYDDDMADEGDDLYLTDTDFVKEWLLSPGVCESLNSISISDFWVQSCWRRSGVLGLLSSICHNLLELQIKNAWLSVGGLSPMPKLTSLTLEFIRLDDEDLNKVNECFPSLQVLNLIGVGGLKEPKIHLMHLRSCKWAVSNAPNSVTVVAPNLVKLELKCVRPKLLVIETPQLFDLCLSLEETTNFRVQEFHNLETLHLQSTAMSNLLKTFPCCKTIKNLTVGSTRWVQPIGVTKFGLESLFSVFPNISSLTLTPGAWSEFELYLWPEGLEARTQLKGLKRITAYLELHDIDVTLAFIFSILDNCTSLSEMALLIHRDVVTSVAAILTSRCMAHSCNVRWRWGMWKEGGKDIWLSDCVCNS